VANSNHRRNGASAAVRASVEAESLLDPSELPAAQGQRRDRILKTASRMLERKEYAEIQMRDVGEGADVALGTLYRYFASKERLFAAVLIEWSRSMAKRIQADPLRGNTPATRLKDVMSRVLDSFERRPQVFRVLMALEDSTDAHTLALMQLFGEGTRQSFGQAVDKLSPEDAGDVLSVVTAVLTDVLRTVVLGYITMDQGRARVSRGIDVVFSAPADLSSSPNRAS
jgi:AcrR family transcriptional regulator